MSEKFDWLNWYYLTFVKDVDIFLSKSLDTRRGMFLHSLWMWTVGFPVMLRLLWIWYGPPKDPS